ncbi:DUF4244 domain-containing protein [Dactylosporangium sp. NPDC051484]|uniref:DUF4244 domain-containing protein n=1 Tax=Dactylosporangium sp. NPDC051484 TaxID=3154942 RepID=UPI00344DCC3C
MHAIKARLLAVRRGEEGSMTVEYAMVMIICVALAGILLAIVSSAEVRAHLTGIVMRSLA